MTLINSKTNNTSTLTNYYNLKLVLQSEAHKYDFNFQDDLDKQINDKIRNSSYGVAIAIAAYELNYENLKDTSVALAPGTIKLIFDGLWEHFIDPKAD